MSQLDIFFLFQSSACKGEIIQHSLRFLYLSRNTKQRHTFTGFVSVTFILYTIHQRALANSPSECILKEQKIKPWVLNVKDSGIFKAFVIIFYGGKWLSELWSINVFLTLHAVILAWVSFQQPPLLSRHSFVSISFDKKRNRSFRKLTSYYKVKTEKRSGLNLHSDKQKVRFLP